MYKKIVICSLMILSSFIITAQEIAVAGCTSGGIPNMTPSFFPTATVYINIEKAKNYGYILDLPDTSHLSVRAVPRAYDKPRLVLEHSKGGWWKGLVKFKKSDPTNWEEIVCVSEGTTTSANYLTSDLATDYIVTISYAKELGAHTNMYSIRNLEDFGQDHDWYFIWIKGS